MKIYRCLLIMPYFGELKSYFSLFLKSCYYNSKINFLIFTDNTIIEKYKNVKIVKMSFFEYKKIFVDKIGHFVSLNSPYKLCDFKPTYGYVFEDYLNDYDYWGYCDSDVIFGDIYSHLFPLFEKGYDKIFPLGHLTLIKNTYENNRIFMSKYKNKYLYKDYLGKNEICWFDEAYKDDNNIHFMFKSFNKKVYEEDLSLNPKGNTIRFMYRKYDPNTNNFFIEKIGKSFIFWKEGKLIRITKLKNDIICNDELYIHLQHRKMRINTKTLNSNLILILPNRFSSKKNMYTKKMSFIIHKSFSFDSITDFIKNLLFRCIKKLRGYNPNKLTWRK